ncbi:MAG: phage major capsid protein [Bradyrhizobium sp.]|uniref:phage major capsid protein n=1 Tax=Bradyrhizobium sp. TaxID=376 RepID=UPI003D0C4F08
MKPKDLVSLRQERAKVHEKLVALGIPTNDEEQTAFDAAVTEVEAVDKQIANVERLNKLKAGGATAGSGSDPGGNQSADKFESLGDQLIAVAAAANGGARDPRLVWQNLQAASGASEGSGPDGGFLVQSEFYPELLKRAYDKSELASRVRKIPIGANANGLRINAIKETSRANGSRFGGIQAYWTAEGGTKVASQMKFRQMDLKLHKLAGVSYVTDELLEDATALEGVIKEAFEDEFSFVIDDAIFEGTGAGMPLGIMKSSALVSVAKEGSQAADTVVVENIVKMWARLWARSRRTAIWTINQQIEPQLYTMKIGDTPVYLPNGTVANSPYATLMGRPVIPTEFNSALGDKGDIVLMDPKEYLMIEKGGVKSATSIHVKFLTDETTFRFVVRVDGQPIWEAPLTPFKGADTLSPFVTLDDRA